MGFSRRPRREAWVALPALLLACVVSVAGCSDDAEPPNAPPESSSGSVSTPEVEPAAGDLLTMPPVSMNVPAGEFSLATESLETFRATAKDEFGASFISVGAVPDLSGGNNGLDELVDIVIDTSFKERPPKRVADLMIAGVTFAHLSGQYSRESQVELFTANHEGNQLIIEFDLRADLTQAEVEAIVQPSLATVQIA